MFMTQIVGPCLNWYFASFIYYSKIKQWNGAKVIVPNSPVTERNMKLRASPNLTQW